MPREPTGSRQSTQRNTARVANVTDFEALNTQPLAEDSLKNGNQWIFREEFELDDGESVDIIVSNPAENTDRMRVIGRDIEPDKAFSGEVTFNRDIEADGTEFMQVNARIENPVPTDSPFLIAYDGTYTNPQEYPDGHPLEGQTVSLPIRAPRGQDPPGVATAVARDPATALWRLLPGSNAHIHMESEENGNIIAVNFIVSERGENEEL